MQRSQYRNIDLNTSDTVFTVQTVYKFRDDDLNLARDSLGDSPATISTGNWSIKVTANKEKLYD